MTKPLVTLPCTAQKLENALHAACDHDGLWDAKIVLIPPRFGDPSVCHPYYYKLVIETETKGETK